MLLRNISAERFNEKYAIGTQFRYYLIPGVSRFRDVVTCSAAWTQINGKVVVKIDGQPGGISVSHLEFLAPPIPSGEKDLSVQDAAISQASGDTENGR